MNQGDIYLAHFPYTDGTSAKLRPILIISSNRFNGSEDVVVLPISSRPASNDPYSINIVELSSDFKETGLKISSAIKWTKPMRISKSVIRRYPGRLSTVYLDSTLAQMQNLFN